MEKFSNYLEEKLKDNIEIENYLNAALEEFFVDHNKELFLVSLRQIIGATGGITKIARETKINRQHLYRLLSNKGNPTFGNIGSLLAAVGFKLKVECTENVKYG